MTIHNTSFPEDRPYRDTKYKEFKRRLGPRRFENVVFISRKFGYVYVSIAKAACTTIKLALCRAETGNRDYNPAPGRQHDRNHLPLLRPGQLTEHERSTLFEGSFFLFSFVRHPFKRALSAYIDKILGQKKQKSEILSAMGMAPDELEYPVSFDEFVEVIAAQEPDRLNPHWRPQTLNLASDLIAYDFIGAVESIHGDMAELRSRIKLPDFDIPHKNQQSIHVSEHLEISSDTISRLENIYADDLRTFSYSSDIKLT